jgi:hypothetical protein
MSQRATFYKKKGIMRLNRKIRVTGISERCKNKLRQRLNDRAAHVHIKQQSRVGHHYVPPG